MKGQLRKARVSVHTLGLRKNTIELDMVTHNISAWESSPSSPELTVTASNWCLVLLKSIINCLH